MEDVFTPLDLEVHGARVSTGSGLLELCGVGVSGLVLVLVVSNLSAEGARASAIGVGDEGAEGVVVALRSCFSIRRVEIWGFWERHCFLSVVLVMFLVEFCRGNGNGWKAILDVSMCGCADELGKRCVSCDAGKQRMKDSAAGNAVDRSQ